MTFLIAAACGAVIWAAIAFPVAVVVGKAAHHADPGEDGPDDLMALVQPENLRLPDTGIDAEFRRLTDPLERERRLRGRVIWP